MILMLHRLLNVDGLSLRQANEALGRLALIATRSVADLASLSQPGLFTDAGLRVLASCRNALSEAVSARRGELMGLNLSDQPYAFSYSAFALRNPQYRA